MSGLVEVEGEAGSVFGGGSGLRVAVDGDVVTAGFDREEDGGVDSFRDVDGDAQTAALFLQVDFEKTVRGGLSAAGPVEVEKVGADGGLAESEARWERCRGPAP